MIRLLNVISGLNNAGTESVVMNYLRNMDKTQIVQDFLVLNTEKGYYEEEIKSLDGKIYKIPNFAAHPIKNMRMRKQFFKEHKYDIVEVHSPTPLRYAYCKLAKKAGSRTIFHLHSSISVNELLKCYSVDKLKKYCDEIVSCSKFAADIALNGVCDKIVSNAINFDFYRFDEYKRNSLRKKLGISDDIKVIGHVGRYSDQKNQSFLISVFAKALQIKSNMMLYLKGFGEDKNMLQDEIRKFGLEGRIILDDSDTRACDLYNIFDLFAFPSKSEGLGVVLIEAQANGLNCLASCDVPIESNILDVVEFLPLDENDWIQKIICDKTYTRKNIEKAEFEKTGYDITTAANERLQEYKDMVTKR